MQWLRNLGHYMNSPIPLVAIAVVLTLSGATQHKQTAFRTSEMMPSKCGAGAELAYERISDDFEGCDAAPTIEFEASPAPSSAVTRI